jgi:hypothetical protein
LASFSSGVTGFRKAALGVLFGFSASLTIPELTRLFQETQIIPISRLNGPSYFLCVDGLDMEPRFILVSTRHMVNDCGPHPAGDSL